MTDPKPATPDHEILVLQGRITLALQRISAGYAPMRIPAELTDPDLVLSDCAARIAADAETIRNQAEEIEQLKGDVQRCRELWKSASGVRPEIELANALAAAREQVRTLREALDEIKSTAGHQSMPYPSVSNSDTCDMASRLIAIAAIAEATEPK